MNEQYGASMDVEGDRVIIGTWHGSGSAEIHRVVNGVWSLEAELLPPPGAAVSEFGGSVVLCGDTAFVGSPSDHERRGAVHVFRRVNGAWTHHDVISVDHGPNSRLGLLMCWSGDRLVISAPGEDKRGAVHVFRPEGDHWVHEARLVPATVGEHDLFAYVVAAEPGTIVIGASDRYWGENEWGAAFVYRHHGGDWILEAELRPEPGSRIAQFGQVLALHDGTIAVGVPADPGNGEGSGAVHLFRHDGVQWRPEQRVIQFSPEGPQGFAWRMHIEAERLYIAESNAVYLFLRDARGWTQAQRLKVNFDQAFNSIRGMAAEGGRVVVSTAGDDWMTPASDSAMVIDGMPFVDCNDNTVPDACEVAEGTMPDANANGVPDACEPAACQPQIRVELRGSEQSLRFGSALAFDGEFLLVGAEDRGLDDEGSVDCYTRFNGKWGMYQRLNGPDGQWNYNLGTEAAMSGGWAAATARGNPPQFGHGVIHVYRREGVWWNEHQRLHPGPVAEDAMMREVVAMNDQWIVAQVFGDDVPNVHRGSVVVFRREGDQWSLHQKLIAPDGAVTWRFGMSIGFDGTTLMVAGGTPVEGFHLWTGKVFVYELNGGSWTHRQTILTPTASLEQTWPNEGSFKVNVEVSGEHCLVAANEFGGDLFRLTTMYRRVNGHWVFAQSLPILHGHLLNEFPALGDAADLKGNVAVLRREFEALVYEFDGASWVRRHRIRNSPTATECAQSVALHSGSVVVGVPSDSNSQSFLFPLIPMADCNDNTLPDACDIGPTLSQDDNANGVPDECDCRDTDLHVQTIAGSLPHVELAAVAIDSRGSRAIISKSINPNLAVARIYDRTGRGWTLRAELAPSIPGAGFAGVLAINGPHAAVGAPESSQPEHHQGRVFTYRRVAGEWIGPEVLAAHDPQNEGRFGTSVAIHDNVLVIGAPGPQGYFGPTSGAVYIYRHDGSQWVFAQKVVAENKRNFGHSVDIDSEKVVVASTIGSTPQLQRGSVSILKVVDADWQVVQTITEPQPTNDDFVDRVQCDEKHIVVSEAVRKAAYCYRQIGGQWTLAATLRSPTPQFGSWFGSEIALSGDRLMITDPTFRWMNQQVGAAYLAVWEDDHWQMETTFMTIDEPGHIAMGGSVAMGGNDVMIAGTAEPPSGSSPYCVFAYDLGGDCNHNHLADRCDISSGSSHDRNDNGVPDECDAPPCIGDIAPAGGDGVVDVNDLIAVVADWGLCAACEADLNADGRVNMADLLLVINVWGPCPRG